MSWELRRGPIDVHAHWLPRELFGLPPGAPFGGIADRDGRMFIGDTPLSIDTRLMSDVGAIRADMERAGVGARVLSAPPFAFALGTAEGTTDYVESFNAQLTQVVADGEGWFAGFGCVSLADPDAAGRQLQELAATPGILGVAIPPLLGAGSLDSEPLEGVLRRASALGLAVLVHPMQLPSPSLAKHYLVNLIGNPVESATAIASVLLGGVLERIPELRICFVHGGGCAPDLLGRWSHAWHARPDVSAGSGVPPEEAFRSLWLDTVTHDADAFDLLAKKAGAGRVLLGSDYPFDMADPDPVVHAIERGLSAESLDHDARGFLGLDAPHQDAA
ncbi:amidohydrolase family protein [Herbiconiux ginsengi]|uniref:Aminocarboxymuconate-semialdehyde decarboxylase n=1 Tax=Herbiconiux ginsengi TaxID=381665 RepID=A0A1H3LFY7_9MICO|nr:amidohydrolase family protein [Herbiconiux ginsengi]SDY63220.1 aminocarboxymuconate-semialdehyde decarboxylase [Herbiconiux ginsengi]